MKFNFILSSLGEKYNQIKVGFCRIYEKTVCFDLGKVLHFHTELVTCLILKLKFFFKYKLLWIYLFPSCYRGEGMKEAKKNELARITNTEFNGYRAISEKRKINRCIFKDCSLVSTTCL